MNYKTISIIAISALIAALILIPKSVQAESDHVTTFSQFDGDSKCVEVFDNNDGDIKHSHCNVKTEDARDDEQEVTKFESPNGDLKCVEHRGNNFNQHCNFKLD